ncbi:unnamed protein product [Absidia cylindrospora]
MINITSIKPALRTFSEVSSSPRWLLPFSTRRTMSAFSQMSDNDPEVLEREKNKQASKKDKDWQEKLATHSEAAIKADKYFEKSTKELQDESVNSLKDEK